jgi:hypothetical protein
VNIQILLKFGLLASGNILRIAFDTVIYPFPVSLQQTSLGSY